MFRRQMDVCLVKFENEDLMKTWKRELESIFGDFTFIDSNMVSEQNTDGTNDEYYGVFLYFYTEGGKLEDYERELLFETLDFTKEPPPEGIDLTP